jgi:choice-of-anchor A domain-containing protein
MSNAMPRASRRRTGSLVLAGAATACAAIAIAAVGTFQTTQASTGYNPLTPALGFNAFVEDQTLLASTESEGGIATGGNLVLGTYNVNIHDASMFIAPGDSVPSSLVVGGRIDFDQAQAGAVVQVHDYVKVGDLTGTDVLNTDSNNASVNTRLVVAGADYNSTPRVELNLQQPLASVGPTSPIDFDTAFAELRSNAADLYACEAHEVAMTNDQTAAVAKGEVQPGEQIRITLEPGVTNVLNVTGEDLNNMGDLVFLSQPDADAPLLINVDTSGTGGEMDWDVKSQAGISGDQAPYIIWNFNDTTRLRLTGGDTVEGSILAPDADYSDISPTNVEGQIVARNANLGEVGENGGEIHDFPFAAEPACEAHILPSHDGSTGETTTGDSPSSPDGGTDGTTDGATGGSTHGSTDGSTDGSDDPAGSDEYSGGRGDHLATTGSGLGAFVIGAGSLVTVGAVAMFSARRRRTDEPD